MAKRSPWAKQPKSQVFKIRQAHGQLNHPKKIKDALVLNKRYPNITTQEKIDFLKRHAKEAARANKKFTKGIKQSTLEECFRKGMLQWMENEHDTNSAFANTLNLILGSGRNSERLTGEILKKTAGYLEERKIPVEPHILGNALSAHFKKNKMETPNQALDLRAIEKEYIKHRKFARMIGFEANKTVNFYLGKIIGNARLNPGQKKAAKKWLFKELGKHEERLENEANNLFLENEKEWTQETAEKINRKIEEIDAEFVEGAQKTLWKRFLKQAKHQPEPARKRGEAEKLGRRDERMARYTPKEKNPKQRQAEIKTAENMAKRSGRRFDSAEYAIRQIASANPGAGRKFRELAGLKKLDRESIVRLFTSGTLAQKTFLKAVVEKGFESRFGQRDINALAKGIAFIGPVGRKIEKAKKAFQSPKGKQIFEFLEKEGLVETHHSGGSVAYLKRE